MVTNSGVSRQGKRKPDLRDKVEWMAIVFSVFAFLTGLSTWPEIHAWWCGRSPSTAEAPLIGTTEPASILVTTTGDDQPDALIRAAPRCPGTQVRNRLSELLPPSVAEGVFKQVDLARGNHQNLWFVIGCGLSLDNQFHMLELWNGYFYDSALSHEQAAVMGTQDGSQFWFDTPAIHDYVEAPALEICELDLHNVMPLASGSPICGKMRYRMLKPPKDGKPLEIAAGLSIGRAGAAMSRVNYAGVADPVGGWIEFKFDSIVTIMSNESEAGDAVTPGPGFLFFCIVRGAVDEQKFDPLCHPVAVLLDVK